MDLLLELAFPLVIALIFGRIALYFALVAVVFSRVVIGLLLTALLSQSFVLIAGNGLVNFLVWGGIVAAIFFLLFSFSRISYAIQFFSTSLMTLVSIFFLYTFLNSLLGMAGLELPINLLIVKIASLAVAAYATLAQIKNTQKLNRIDLFPFVMMERILSALIFAAGAMLVCSFEKKGESSFTTVLPSENGSHIWVFVITGIVVFLLDLFFLERYHEVAYSSNVVRNLEYAAMAPSEREQRRKQREYEEELRREEWERDQRLADDLAFYDLQDKLDREEQEWRDSWRYDD